MVNDFKNKNLYDDGLVVTYPEGDVSLERFPLVVLTDIQDDIHIVNDGDTLTSIAHKYYRNSRLWWVIADVNEIIEIFDLEVGSELIIPNKKKLK